MIPTLEVERQAEILGVAGNNGEAANAGLPGAAVPGEDPEFLRYFNLTTSLSPQELIDGIEPEWPTGELGQFQVKFVERLAYLFERQVLSRLMVEQFCEAGVRRMRERGYEVRPWTRFRKEVFDLAKRLTEVRSFVRRKARQAAAAEVPVRRFVPDAPLPDTVTPPQGWNIGASGVSRSDGREEGDLIRAPVVITARLLHLADRTESVRLAWKRDGGWVERDVERSVIANTRKIVDLAAYGLPVTTLNAGAAVEYLSSFEAKNLGRLPTARVTSQLGWCDETLSAFLWGHELLQAGPTPTDEDPFAAVPDGSPAATEPAETRAVRFQGADAGDEQLAEGFQAGGTLDGWRAAVAPALPFPRARLALLTSLSTPLLSVLGAQNYVTDLCGNTSTGKTTTLRLAASVWGNPDERAPAGALSGWNTTRVWIERGAAVLKNLPVILDDTKLARRKEDVATVLYDIVAGRGRGRGSVKGMSRTSTWATALLTSGEAPATSFTQDGGTRARVLELWGAPFGGADASTAALVQALNTAVREHYGHAGPEFVRYLLRRRERWGVWKARYEQVKAAYVARAQGNPVVGRLADALAVLTLTGHLAARALSVPALRQSPVKELWADLAAEAEEADRPGYALRHVLDWALSHQEEFFGRRDAQKGQPSQGWAGSWDRGPWSAGGGRKPWEFLGFLTSRLKAVVEDGGYEYEAVVRNWRDRGWLKVDPSEKKQRYHQVRIDGERCWVIAIRREFVEGLLGEVGPSGARADDPARVPGESRLVPHRPSMSGVADDDREQAEAACEQSLDAQLCDCGQPR
jgi:putative DNA primase/helicase